MGKIIKEQIQGSLTRDKFTEDLAQLIAFRTVTSLPEGFVEALSFVQDQIDPRAQIELLENKGKFILLASNHPGKIPDVCYLVHLDVVPGKPEQFIMQVRDGSAVGRGASDMKFSIPIGYALLNDLIHAGSPLSFMLAITTDEETGGFDGAKYLAEQYGLSPKLLIVPDGGENFTIINKSKAVCHIKLTTRGRPAHSSRPWLGESALEPMVYIASELFNRYKNQNHTEGWHTTMTIGRFTSGRATNQVPDSAEMHIDFRFPAEDTSAASLFEEVSIIANDIDPRVEVEIGATGDSTFVDTSNPALRLFIQIVSNQLGREIDVKGTHESTDARHFNKNGIVPFIMIKPECGDEHGDDEYIIIDSAMVFYQMLLNFLAQHRA